MERKVLGCRSASPAHRDARHMQTEEALAFPSSSPLLWEDFQKTNKKRTFLKRKEGRKEGREERRKKRERKKELSPLRTGIVIIHVDVNISTKTGSRKIPPGELLRAHSGALSNYCGLLISLGRGKKSPAPHLLFFFLNR